MLSGKFAARLPTAVSCRKARPKTSYENSYDPNKPVPCAVLKANLKKSLSGPTGIFSLSVELSAHPGEILALYGPSGAGKTSVLRMMAGLLPPDEIDLFFRGQNWRYIPPSQRNIGFVFQDYALFPNMTVRENINFASRPRSFNQQQLLEVFELTALTDHRPAQLSGGQQQRVALARALVQGPDLLLLDEPLSALEHRLRVKLGNYLKQAVQEYGITTILVSHDLGEVVRLADQVIQLEAGQVTASGTPENVLLNDVTETGIPAEVLRVDGEQIVVRVGQSVLRVPTKEHAGKPGERIRLRFG